MEDIVSICLWSRAARLPSGVWTATDPTVDRDPAPCGEQVKQIEDAENPTACDGANGILCLLFKNQPTPESWKDRTGSHLMFH